MFAEVDQMLNVNQDADLEGDGYSDTNDAQPDPLESA